MTRCPAAATAAREKVLQSERQNDRMLFTSQSVTETGSQDAATAAEPHQGAECGGGVNPRTGFIKIAFRVGQFLKYPPSAVAEQTQQWTRLSVHGVLVAAVAVAASWTV